MKKQVLFLAVALLVAVGTAGAGTYGTVNMTYVNDGPAETASVFAPVSLPGGSGPYYIGRSNFTINSFTNGVGLSHTNPLGSAGSSTTAYCVDLQTLIYGNTTATWDVELLDAAPTAGPMGGTKANKVTDLLVKHESSVGSDAAKAAALQAAIWEVIYENTSTYDVTSGGLYLSGLSASAVSYANLWLSEPVTSDYTTDKTYALLQIGTQDFGWILPGSRTPPVPEPITMFSAFMAIGSLGMYIRKRMRVTAA
jgi:hypothetical protein